MRAMTRWLFVPILGLVFTSLPAMAQDGKTPDLTDLRDAVKAASKRGGNMIDVAKALDELEKALAKGIAASKEDKKAAVPSELTALREAVETAGRKGEKVDAIRKELASIEIALTGKAYERPKVEPPPEPSFPIEPNFGRRGRFGPGGFGPRRGGVIIRGMEFNGHGGSSTAITISGKDFTIRAIRDDVKYELQGTIGDDGPILDKVTITDGDKKPVEAKKLKDVPANHKATVEKLLKSISRD